MCETRNDSQDTENMKWFPSCERFDDIKVWENKESEAILCVEKFWEPEMTLCVKYEITLFWGL